MFFVSVDLFADSKLSLSSDEQGLFVCFDAILVIMRRYVLWPGDLFLWIDKLKSLDFNDSDFGSETQLDKALFIESFGALCKNLNDGFFLLFFKFDGVWMDTRGSRIKFQYQQVVKPNYQIPLTVQNMQGDFLLWRILIYLIKLYQILSRKYAWLSCEFLCVSRNPWFLTGLFTFWLFLFLDNINLGQIPIFRKPRLKFLCH